MTGAPPAISQPARAIWGILFAEDFDNRKPAPASVPVPPEPEVIEPTFSAEELEAARAAGHAEGLVAGLAQAEDAHRQAVRTATQAIAVALADAADQGRQVAEATAEALTRSVLATLCAALPALCVRHGEAELREILKVLLPSLSHEPRVTVRVHPTLVAPLGQEIEALGPELSSIVVLSASEALPPGDIRIAWHHGAASRDTRSILAEIDDALGLVGLREAAHRAVGLHLADRPGRTEELAHVG